MLHDLFLFGLARVVLVGVPQCSQYSVGGGRELVGDRWQLLLTGLLRSCGSGIVLKMTVSGYCIRLAVQVTVVIAVVRTVKTL